MNRQIERLHNLEPLGQQMAALFDAVVAAKLPGGILSLQLELAFDAVHMFCTQVPEHRNIAKKAVEDDLHRLKMEINRIRRTRAARKIAALLEQLEQLQEEAVKALEACEDTSPNPQ